MSDRVAELEAQLEACHQRINQDSHEYLELERKNDLITRILKEARPFVARANYEADCRHDNTLELNDYEIMQQTESLLERIDAALAG